MYKTLTDADVAEPFMMDTKGEGGVQYLPVRPCRFDAVRFKLERAIRRMAS